MSPSILRTTERLAGTPAVRRGGHWWLVASTGSLLASDPAFTDELDRLAADLAAADRAVAEVRAARNAQHEARR
ncbi:hypothetical protein ACH437_15160 [Streptomyces xinghaiensis]|uniref:hypothetical protein n=1 Tax=Streptomyces xinghaiensis TaxID=1038928 RepID=UPI0037B35F90